MLVVVTVTQLLASRTVLVVKNVLFEMVAEEEDSTPVLVYNTSRVKLPPNTPIMLGISSKSHSKAGSSLKTMTGAAQTTVRSRVS